MPIDPEKALGATISEGEGEWNRDQVILYHLGVGAGNPPTDPGEPEYTYEKNLKVLPSYGVIPVFGALGGLGNVPGLQFNFAMLLHGEQDLTLHKPIPPEADSLCRFGKNKTEFVILSATKWSEESH